jgi:hypothetical protein
MCVDGVCQAVLLSGCNPPCGAGQICAQLGSSYQTPGVPVCAGTVCGQLSPSNPQMYSGYCLARDGELGVCCTDGSCADIANDPSN